MTAEVVPMHSRHGQEGYFSLADLPQRGSIAKQAFGVGWWELDEIFKFYLGQFVVVTGVAGHGKSTFILNCLTKLAKDRGVASFLYVPENEGYLREKLRKLWPGDAASFEHYCESQCFIQSAVVGQNETPRTMRWVLNQATIAVERDRVEIVMIDPWNELDRAKPKDMLLSDYIGACLMEVKDFCRTMNCAVIVVAHPTKAVNEGGGRVPGLADIEGSMNWFNKCDNGLIVVRDLEKNSARVISAKVREIGAGKIGACHFFVDPQTGIYTPMTGAVTL
jgi:twinkle protein